METHNLDLEKLVACIKLGRRFYVVSNLVINYVDKILKRFESEKDYYINYYLNEPSGIVLKLSKERNHRFNPLEHRIITGHHSKCYEIYDFNRSVFVNFYSYINIEEFDHRYNASTYYPYENRINIFKKLKNIHINQLPIEVNISEDEIKSDDGRIIFYNRRMLIELLYFSNNVFNFFNKFTNYLLGSTIFYHGIMHKYIMGNKFGNFPNFYNDVNNDDGTKLMKLFYGG